MSTSHLSDLLRRDAAMLRGRLELAEGTPGTGARIAESFIASAIDAVERAAKSLEKGQSGFVAAVRPEPVDPRREPED